MSSSIIKKHDYLPNIYITGDTSVYVVKYDNKELELKFDETGFNSQEVIDTFPTTVKDQVEVLQQTLIEDKLNGTESEYNDDSDINPFDPNKIDIEKKVVTMETIIRRIEQGTIKLNPDFQRKEVWNDERKCQLIESLLLRIPIPLFYVSAAFDDSWTVVDGLQRLSTIRDFILGKEYLIDKDRNRERREHGFVLQGLEFCGSILNGSDMHGLPTIYYNRIMETEFTFVIIKPGTPEEVKRNVFKRINTGGMQLSSQEIRNALYSGFSTKLLNKLSDLKDFKEATGWSVKTQRMEDKELILRMLAFLVREQKNYSKSNAIDTWLSDTMVIINSFPSLNTKDFKRLNINENEINVMDENQFVQKFLCAMIRAKQLFGQHAFRKSFGENRRAPINKSLFEMWGVILSALSEQQFAKLLLNKNKFIVEYSKYLINYDFIIAISRDSMKKSSVNFRYSKMYDIINKYI